MSGLPKSWMQVSLGEDTISKKGKKPNILATVSKEDLAPYLDIKAFEKGIYEKYARLDSGVECEINDSLMVWDGARSGLVGNGVAGVIGSTLMRIRPKGSNNRYLHYFLRSKFSEINSKTKGTGIPHVDPAILWNFEFPIAPLNEQIRIADKLDSILAKVDAAQARLDKIPNILKRFRQSVLAAATSGELTKEWREIQGERKTVSFDELLEKKSDLIIKKLVKKDLELELLSELEIPSSWIVVNLGGLASKVTDGEHKTPQRESEGRYLLSARNIRDGFIKLEKVDYVGEEEFEKLRKRCDPNKGDILISCSGSVGRITLCDKDDEYVMVRSAALVKTDLMEQNNKYLMYSLQSPVLQQIIVNKSKSTAQSNLFLGPIKELPIPLPPKEEQNEIVRRVESLFIMADTVEKQYNAAKVRTNRLTQSMLAKAFRGELVSQDENDEPASKLLEKIKAEFVNTSVKKKKTAPKKEIAKTSVATKEVVENKPGKEVITTVEKELTLSWSGKNTVYVEKAIKELKNTTFTLEQFESVTGFPNNYEELKNLVLALVKGIPGGTAPLFEIANWDKKTGNYSFKIKDK